MKLFARWNTRTEKLAPLGDLIGYPPYLYTTRDEAGTAIFHAATTKEEFAVEVEIAVTPLGPKRHETPCAQPLSSDTCVYLSDGTKVVLRRGPKVKGPVWLEVVPQEKLTLQGAK